MMQTWLEEAGDQFRQTNELVGQLDSKGFKPIFTAPTHDAEVRRDHTLAIIERLAAWSPQAIQFPLKIFSTGPVFEHGGWAESLDVEVLEDGPGDADRIVFDLLSHLIAERFVAPAQKDLVFVAGHLGLLRRLLILQHWTLEDVLALERNMSQGKYSRVEQSIRESSPELLPLFRPSSPAAAVRHIESLQDVVSRDWDVSHWMRSLPKAIDHVPRVLWDLSLTGSFTYYAGPVFALYRRGQGAALIKGGRFSVHHQGRDWQGAGFTIALSEWFGL